MKYEFKVVLLTDIGDSEPASAASAGHMAAMVQEALRSYGLNAQVHDPYSEQIYPDEGED